MGSLQKIPPLYLRQKKHLHGTVACIKAVYALSDIPFDECGKGFFIDLLPVYKISDESGINVGKILHMPFSFVFYLHLPLWTESYSQYTINVRKVHTKLYFSPFFLRLRIFPIS